MNIFLNVFTAIFLLGILSILLMVNYFFLTEIILGRRRKDKNKLDTILRNRCDNGWSEVENPPNTVQKEPQEDDKPGTKSFPITDPLLIQKLDSLSPEEMENLQKILVESMKELREKHEQG